MKTIFGVAVTVYALTALPVCAGVPELLNAFGMFPLDAKVSETRLRALCKTDSEDVGDAAYICPDGLEYVVYGNAITTIRYRFVPTDANTSILGVHAGDNETTVVKHIADTYGVSLKKFRVENWNVYATDMTTVESCGQKCDLNFSFAPNGLIAEITKEPEVPYE